MAMRSIHLRHGTLPVVMLVVVILWALGAVLMLTTTLITAQEIQNRVGVINRTLHPIDKNLDAVALSTTTAGIAKEISKAADPLTGQLKIVDNAGWSIDRSAKSIMKNAGSINGKAKSINSKVKTINGSVLAINSTANSINSNVRSIGARLSSVGGNVSTINASARGIFGSFTGTLNRVYSIDKSVARANGQILQVISTVRGIKTNTGTIRALVPSIITNARAIEGNPLLLRNLGLLNLLGIVPAPATPPVAAQAKAQVPAAEQAAAVQPASQSPIESVVGGLVGGLLGPPPAEESQPPSEQAPPAAPPVEDVEDGAGGLIGSLLAG
jgi:hypothetical protein